MHKQVKCVDYTEVGEFFGEEKKPLTEENFEAYKAKYGAERAEGYLQAIADMNNEMNIILYHLENRNPDEYCPSSSGHVVKKHIINLFEHNNNFWASVPNPVNPEQLDNPSLG